MMVCVPLSLLFGAIGIFVDRPRWLAIAVTLVALLLMLPFLANILMRC